MAVKAWAKARRRALADQLFNDEVRHPVVRARAVEWLRDHAEKDFGGAGTRWSDFLDLDVCLAPPTRTTRGFKVGTALSSQPLPRASTAFVPRASPGRPPRRLRKRGASDCHISKKKSGAVYPTPSGHTKAMHKGQSSLRSSTPPSGTWTGSHIFIM